MVARKDEWDDFWTLAALVTAAQCGIAVKRSQFRRSFRAEGER